MEFLKKLLGYLTGANAEQANPQWEMGLVNVEGETKAVLGTRAPLTLTNARHMVNIGGQDEPFYVPLNQELQENHEKGLSAYRFTRGTQDGFIAVFDPEKVDVDLDSYQQVLSGKGKTLPSISTSAGNDSVVVANNSTVLQEKEVHAFRMQTGALSLSDAADPQLVKLTTDKMRANWHFLSPEAQSAYQEFVQDGRTDMTNAQLNAARFHANMAHMTNHAMDAQGSFFSRGPGSTYSQVASAEFTKFMAGDEEQSIAHGPGQQTGTPQGEFSMAGTTNSMDPYTAAQLRVAQSQGRNSPYRPRPLDEMKIGQDSNGNINLPAGARVIVSTGQDAEEDFRGDWHGKGRYTQVTVFNDNSNYAQILRVPEGQKLRFTTDMHVSQNDLAMQPVITINNTGGATQISRNFGGIEAAGNIRLAEGTNLADIDGKLAGFSNLDGENGVRDQHYKGLLAKRQEFEQNVALKKAERETRSQMVQGIHAMQGQIAKDWQTFNQAMKYGSTEDQQQAMAQIQSDTQMLTTLRAFNKRDAIGQKLDRGDGISRREQYELHMANNVLSQSGIEPPAPTPGSPGGGGFNAGNRFRVRG